MSDLHNEWIQLQRAALLGTERAAVPDALLSQSLGINANNDQAEHHLLLGVGLVDFYQQIGRKLATTNALPASQPSSQQPTASKLTSYINTMLDGRYRDLLPELLQALIDSGQTVAPELLPNLLTLGEKTPQHRYLIYQTIGRTGHRLASLRPEWHYATSNIYEWERAQQIWRNPKPVKRQAFLRQLRHLNPVFARELVTSSWKAEAQQQRLWFIRLMSINLSVEDEPFLEMALDDRMLAVRREAIKLLTMLPSSKLCQRMTNATRLVLTWSKAEQRVVVRFPVGVSRLLQRDGVPVQANPKNVARLRGEQLSAMVMAVPLDRWTERFGVSAETIIASLPESKWPRTLTKVFIEAALRQQNQRWALALLNNEVKSTSAKLFGVLSAEQQATLLTNLMAKQTSPFVVKGDQVQLLLYQNNNAWSADVTNLWLARVEQHFRNATTGEPTALQSDLRNPLFISTIRKMARYAPVELADKIVTTLQPYCANPVWRTKLQDIIGMLRFRQKILNAVA